MNKQDVFPVQAMTEQSESAIKLEGQKVIFDKKVALLPVDVRLEKTTNIKTADGRPERQHSA